LAIKTINPYLFFDGNASDAVTFYEKALDAKVVRMMRFSDGPGAAEMTPGQPDGVMHAQLDAGGGTLLISDARPGTPFTPGDTRVQVCLQYEGRADIDRHFAALAEGGVIEEPLKDQFWGGRFGLLVDKFGVNWMFNATLTE